MKKDNRFKIDFDEFAFLVEACIPPKPIARTMFWVKVIDEYYHKLTAEERIHLYEWINMGGRMQEGVKSGNFHCNIFNARFNPKNQYKVVTNVNGKEKEIKAFLYKDRYWTRSNTHIEPRYIKFVIIDEG